MGFPDILGMIAKQVEPDFNTILLLGLIAWVWRLDIKLRELIVRHHVACPFYHPHVRDHAHDAEPDHPL